MDVIYDNIYMFQTITAIALFLLFSESLELYRSWRTDALTTQLSVTFVCWGMVCGALAFIMYFTPIFDTDVASKQIPLIWLITCTIALPSWRLIGRLVLNQFRAKGSNTRSALVIGSAIIVSIEVDSIKSSIRLVQLVRPFIGVSYTLRV